MKNTAIKVEKLAAELETLKEEIKIEAALERVRVRSMAMQKSDELIGVATVLNQELIKLGIRQSAHSSFVLIDEANEAQYLYGSQTESKLLEYLTLPLFGDQFFQDRFQAWKLQKPIYSVVLAGEELRNHLQVAMPPSKITKKEKDSQQDLPDPSYFYFANFKQGYLQILTSETLNKWEQQILIRFAKVFGQSYTRFLDLQKAEGQTREAEIQLALERVRAQTMAMQKTDELPSVISMIFKQLQELGFDIYSCALILINERKSQELWLAGYSADVLPRSYEIPFNDHQYFMHFMDCWERQVPYDIFLFQGEKKKEYDQYLFEKTELSKLFPHKVSEEMKVIEQAYICSAYMKFGWIEVNSDEPLPSIQSKVLQRFSRVFEQTYTRFLDLQKAEAQAREAQIEAALERVRSRTMAMQKSEELAYIVKVINDETRRLDLVDWGCNIQIMDIEANRMEVWIAETSKELLPKPCYFKNRKIMHPAIKKQWEAYANRNKQPHYTLSLEGSAKESYDDYVFEFTDLKNFPDDIKEGIRLLPKINFNMAFMKYGSITVINSSSELREDQYSVLGRFAHVFEQTYTRFLDLQKAEAQAREAQIEAALERVRSRTMAMQKSSELKEVATVMYEQMSSLKLGNYGFNLSIFNESENYYEVWVSNEDFKIFDKSFLFKNKDHRIVQMFWKAWKEQQTVVIELKDDDKIDYDTYVLTQTDFKFFPEEVKKSIQSVNTAYFSAIPFSYGLLTMISNEEPLNELGTKIAVRFAKVFEQTYTRFLDLQKAESQAREAQIEAALERVRSKSLGMQKSDELEQVVQVLTNQFTSLKPDTVGCWISLVNPDANTMQIWTHGSSEPFYTVSGEDYHAYQADIDAFKKKEHFRQFKLEREEAKVILKEQFEAELVNIPEVAHLYHLNQHLHNFGFIGYSSWTEADEEARMLLKRFSTVFEQTYTRFLDLQKAEAQAREAQIEAALERLRGTSMAMQKSKELVQVVRTLDKEIKELGIEVNASQIITDFADPEKGLIDWYTDDQQDYLGKFHISFIKHPIQERFFEAIDNGTEFYAEHYTNPEKNEYFKLLFEYSDFRTLPQEVQDAVYNFPVWIRALVFSKNSVLIFQRFNLQEFSKEEEEIFKRFGKVFEQAYTRFLDLQNAEKQAKEAVKQSSLDRVRGEIASMRSTADLDRITPLIWNELTTLGVPFIRCGVSIIHEETQKVEMFLSTPDGSSLAMMNLDFDSSELTERSIDYWRKNKVYHQHWSKEEFINWTNSLVKDGKIKDNKAYQGAKKPPETLELYFVPFTQGSLYVGAIAELADEEIELVKSLADAFSIAYARYEDFVKLEKAKQSVETTLTELKATQTQLIQSEKMASLGELTAGIAHEIQNPLNFVNNFSEVSAEMIDELDEELEKGDLEEVKAISSDLKQNLSKINHHGQRASSIVKGMLEHSRKSSGKKELTDINALVDEYLRLAYHGLRAKDKEFQSEFETNLDPNLPKIEVIPQDIGRVVLNLINNAFQAVDEQARKGIKGYKPTVSISTSQEQKADGQEQITISITDNGPGIPEHIKEKIFQPFFTTKPTGSGTGLGLSLSYDIVKAHGGELKVETKEGSSLPAGEAGTEFTIELPI